MTVYDGYFLKCIIYFYILYNSLGINRHKVSYSVLSFNKFVFCLFIQIYSIPRPFLILGIFKL
jgi:hypothetical protein